MISPHDRLGKIPLQCGCRLEAAPLQAHRFEQLFLQIFGERLFLRLLQHIADHADAGVGILDPALRFINQRSAIETPDHVGQGGVPIVKIVAHGRLARQTGPMGHQLTQSDGFMKRIDWLKIGQVTSHRDVEIEPALFHQLHDSDVGEQFGDGADAVDGRGRGGRSRL